MTTDVTTHSHDFVVGSSADGAPTPAPRPAGVATSHPGRDGVMSPVAGGCHPR